MQPSTSSQAITQTSTMQQRSTPESYIASLGESKFSTESSVTNTRQYFPGINVTPEAFSYSLNDTNNGKTDQHKIYMRTTPAVQKISTSQDEIRDPASKHVTRIFKQPTSIRTTLPASAPALRSQKTTTNAPISLDVTTDSSKYHEFRTAQTLSTIQIATTQKLTTQKATTQKPTTKASATQEPKVQKLSSQATHPTTQEPTPIRQSTFHGPTTRELKSPGPATREPKSQRPTTQFPRNQKSAIQKLSTKKPTKNAQTTGASAGQLTTTYIRKKTQASFTIVQVPSTVATERPESVQEKTIDMPKEAIKLPENDAYEVYGINQQSSETQPNRITSSSNSRTSNSMHGLESTNSAEFDANDVTGPETVSRKTKRLTGNTSKQEPTQQKISSQNRRNLARNIAATKLSTLQSKINKNISSIENERTKYEREKRKEFKESFQFEQNSKTNRKSFKSQTAPRILAVCILAFGLGFALILGLIQIKCNCCSGQRKRSEYRGVQKTDDNANLEVTISSNNNKESIQMSLLS